MSVGWSLCCFCEAACSSVPADIWDCLEPTSRPKMCNDGDGISPCIRPGIILRPITVRDRVELDYIRRVLGPQTRAEVKLRLVI